MEQDLGNFIYVILISTLCGFILGFEREIHNKPAGLKTITLVVIGSAVFTFVSIKGFDTTDESRVAAQIVSGIGFLGAGVILRSELKVIGLTTAATLWVAAAVGMLIGTGLMIYAIISTVIVFVIINLFRIFETKLAGKYMMFEITIFLDNEENLSIIRELAENLGMKVEKFEIDKSSEGIILKLKVVTHLVLFFDNFVKELKKKNIKYSL
ncbi:MAG: MgtC/SapB family protein [bacterium]|nr:MgtC/SapB family protein [bacterium]